MSYDPPPYKPPPQGRWPSATPPVPWPSYRDGDVYRDGAVYRDEEGLGGQYAADHQGAYPATAGYQRQLGYQRDVGGSGDRDYPSAAATGTVAPDRNARDGYAWGARDGYAWGARDGYGEAGHGYGPDGYASGYDWNSSGTITDGFDGAQNDVTRRAGYPGRDSYPEPVPSGPVLTAPDADLRPDRWQADQDRRRAAGRRGLAVGAVTGLLAVAVATGVSTLAAAFVRPQAAPVIAMGDVFINRMPAALKSVAMAHFGSHGRTVLLLGMYLAIACLALGMGVLSRHAAAVGVTSLATFTLLSAFFAVTRPEGGMTDVVPAVIGGVAGVTALLWLQRASAPVAPVQPAYGGSRRSR